MNILRISSLKSEETLRTMSLKQNLLGLITKVFLLFIIKSEFYYG